MESQLQIRNETSYDCQIIFEITAAAFATLAISAHAEKYVIDELRKAKALAISLVAEIDIAVVGYIAFWPVTISDGTRDWHGLGPVSVLPEYQRQGIGKALIREGLSRLKGIGARGCCLVGHPEYYKRFGFVHVSGLIFEGVPQEAFCALSFDGCMPSGTVTFHEAFSTKGPVS